MMSVVGMMVVVMMRMVVVIVLVMFFYAGSLIPVIVFLPSSVPHLKFYLNPVHLTIVTIIIHPTTTMVNHKTIIICYAQHFQNCQRREGKKQPRCR